MMKTRTNRIQDFMGKYHIVKFVTLRCIGRINVHIKRHRRLKLLKRIKEYVILNNSVLFVGKQVIGLEVAQTSIRRRLLSSMKIRYLRVIEFLLRVNLRTYLKSRRNSALSRRFRQNIKRGNRLNSANRRRNLILRKTKLNKRLKAWKGRSL